VPFYIRTGKLLPITATEVVVDLKRPPLFLFDEHKATGSNTIRFRLGPEVVISLGARVKVPGEGMKGEAVELVARHVGGTGRDAPYARLLGDALEGDSSLFISDDSVEAAWRVIEPVLAESPPLFAYEPGSWGPEAARQVVAGDEGWHDPAPLTPS
jgi:glucose-6-phosphate 1-dehydrogenase